MNIYDCVYENGKIFTSNNEQLYADTMAVKDGKIAWIGSKAEMSYDSENCINLNGKRVLPGLIDAHFHPIMLASYHKQITCLPPVINSIKELSAEIARVRRESGKQVWIQGWGYDEGKLAERRSVDRYDLDAGCKDMPVSIIRACGHITCFNSKALKLAGIDKNTPDPQGGTIDRDENGEPTGILRENARNLVTRIMPVELEEDVINNIVALNDLMLSQGITSMADMGNFNDVDYYPYYEKAREKGFLPSVSLYYMWEFYKDKEGFSFNASDMIPQKSIRIAGMKLFADGSVTGRTAWCDRPYIGTPDHYGLPVATEKDIKEAVKFCKKNKCQISIHAMGARAIDRAVNGTYEEENWIGDRPAVRIEHAAMPSKQAMQRASQAGIAFVTQPIFLYAEIETYLKNLGHEWTKQTYPVNDMLKYGIKTCFSSDAPTTAWADPSNPFVGIKGAVTRIAHDGTDCGRNYCVDVKTAVELYTREASEILGIENIGQLKTGYLANFIILDRDIFEIPEEDIDMITVEETYMEGKKVYSHNKSPQYRRKVSH
jgi:predicted amidohydrolase YtcJ